MIDQKLLGLVPDSKKYIAANVFCQWLSLLANIVFIYAVTRLITGAFLGEEIRLGWFGLCLLALPARALLTFAAGKLSFLSSKSVKTRLRHLIFNQLFDLGMTYREHVRTSEMVQLATEGVDQLETYFGSYLPQFFYAMLAPLTLFICLSFVSFSSALILFICVPLIPISIALVQTWAKKLLSKYWGKYTDLADTFLENLQGLVCLKIYQADRARHAAMNRQAEQFRQVTMKVLTMQLNSIFIMDLIAYGGAALGIILAVLQLSAGRVDLAGCLLIILLAADFFLPMRLLGSFFHIAMNGIAASGKIFRLLDLKTPAKPSGQAECPAECRGEQAGASVRVEGLSFSYEEGRPVLQEIDFAARPGALTALVGESGCGKSTLAGILSGRLRSDEGAVSLFGKPLSSWAEEDLAEAVTYVGLGSYLFQGTVRDNLLPAQPGAADETLWRVLDRVKLGDFLRSEQGLETGLTEGAANLSGGQRQRLALARAILHDSPIYIFDEATSNIDVESEHLIMAQIEALARDKTVIVIAHRLANVVPAELIYVLQEGRVVAAGRHREMLQASPAYRSLWETQAGLEAYAGGGGQDE